MTIHLLRVRANIITVFVSIVQEICKKNCSNFIKLALQLILKEKMNMENFIIIKYLNCKINPYLIRLNLIFLLFMIVKSDTSSASKEGSKLNRSFDLSICDENDTTEYKEYMKKQFHLNVFDLKDFNRLQKYDVQEHNPCVQTRLKVI